MESRTAGTPQDVLYRLHLAQNRHDLHELVACFAPDFKSEQSVHPGLEFVGCEEVHKTWSRIFNRVPDLQSELVRSVIEGDMVWAEWRWRGTRTDGRSHDLRGVTIFKVEKDRIVWARWFMEPGRLPSFEIDAQLQSRFEEQKGNEPFERG